MKSLPALVLTLAAIIAGFIGLNLTAGVWMSSVRADLTESGLYRLSPGTRDVLNRLDEPVRLTFHYSRTEAASYPAVRAYAERVRELLQAIAAASGGRVRLAEIDPEPFSEAEDTAIAAGLEPLPGEGGVTLFFGLSGVNAVDDRRVIALFDPTEEARLEYDITRLIADLERARRPSLAIVTSLQLEPGVIGAAPNPIIDELSAAYELIWVERDFTALPDADALFIAHPDALNDTQLYLIDQFTLRRGRLLIGLDPMSHFALKPGADGLPPLRARRASDLGPLTARWGVGYEPREVVMDRAAGLPVQVVEDGRARTRAYPLWFTAPPEGLSEDSPALASLTRGVNFGSPGALTALDGVETEFQPLVLTSPEGAILDADIAAGSPSPETLLTDYATDPEAPIVLAAQISGVLQTAFPDGPPASDTAFDPAAHLGQSTGPAQIVIIADIDWLDPAFYTRTDAGGVQIVADNPALALNLIDALAGDRALISLRSRAPSERRMTRVDALRAEAEARYLVLQTELQARLASAEADLAALNAAGAGSALSGAGAEEAAQAEALRNDIVQTRARLRDVERGFRSDIDALQSRLQLWTIWGPGLAVILLGALATLIRELFRARRRRRARPGAARLEAV